MDGGAIFMTEPIPDPVDSDFSEVIVYEPSFITTIRKICKYPIRTFNDYNTEQLFKISKRQYNIMSGAMRPHSEANFCSDSQGFVLSAAVNLARVILSRTRLLRATNIVSSIPIVVFVINETHFEHAWIIFLAAMFIAGIGKLLEIVKRPSNSWAFSTCTVTGTASGVLIYTLSPNQFFSLWHVMPKVSQWTYLLGLIMVLSFYTSLVAIPFFVLVAQAVSRHVLHVYPNYAALEELGLVIEHLDMRGVKARSLNNRNDAILHLEYAAILIQIGVPRKFSAPNAITQSILRKKCETAAAAIRELEAKIAFADKGLENNIRESIAVVAASICLGTYDVQPQDDLNQVSHASFIRKIGRASRTAVIGMLPIAVILTFRYADIKLSPQFNNWAIAIAIIWAVVTFVSALDPLYAKRLKDVQSFVSAFRGGTD
jgi:hypothetical protein